MVGAQGPTDRLAGNTCVIAAAASDYWLAPTGHVFFRPRMSVVISKMSVVILKMFVVMGSAEALPGQAVLPLDGLWVL